LDAGSGRAVVTAPTEGPPQAAPDAVRPAAGPLTLGAGPLAEAADQLREAPRPDRTVPRRRLVASPHGIAAGYRSTPEEQAGFRAGLAGRYDVHARCVTRTLASRPGIRTAGAGESDYALVTDLAAVRAYACRDGFEIDRALRSPDPSAALAVAACVASGLRRLPSFRGVVFRIAAPSGPPGGYVPGEVLTEPAFLTTILSEDGAVPSGTAFAIWSSTGRRTGGLELAGDADAVVFTANTAFKVLAEHASAGTAGCVLLRELPAGPHGGQTGGGLDDEDQVTLDLLEQAMAGPTADGGRAVPAPSYRDAFPVGRNDAGQPFGPAGLL
jgi:hypothetical protein